MGGEMTQFKILILMENFNFLLKGTHYPILYGSQMTCITYMKKRAHHLLFLIFTKKHSIFLKTKSREKVTFFSAQKGEVFGINTVLFVEKQIQRATVI